MFTGIIEEVGIIKRICQSGGSMKIEVSAPKSAKELHINDSVAVNGVCQTVISRSSSAFTVEAVEETLKKTTFGDLRTGIKVNIELPLRLNGRIGGHMVLGHVDTVGKIVKINKKKSSWIFTLAFPAQFSKYVIAEGSIAVDGVSLTIASLNRKEVDLSIIPHTMTNTIFPGYRPNSKVNIEFDVIGKYIENFTHKGDKSSGKALVTKDRLKNLGY